MPVPRAALAQFFPRRPLRVATAIVAALGLVTLGSSAAFADEGRVTSTIGTWIVGTSPNIVSIEPTQHTDPATAGVEFTFPAPGASGPIEFTHPVTGKQRCVVDVQPNPFVNVRWEIPGSQGRLCQNVTTVVEAGTGLIGFMAADGPYQGKYLGDASGGKVIDWDQATFYGQEVPALTPITPAAPTLVPAADCDVEATVATPSASGVVYEQQRSGTMVTVTATAAPGSTLASGAVTEWVFDVAAAACAEPPLVSRPLHP